MRTHISIKSQEDKYAVRLITITMPQCLEHINDSLFCDILGGGVTSTMLFAFFYEFSPAKSEYATYFNESVSTYSSS